MSPEDMAEITCLPEWRYSYLSVIALVMWFRCTGLETHKLFEEGEFHVPGGTVTILGNNELSLSFIRGASIGCRQHDLP